MISHAVADAQLQNQKRAVQAQLNGKTRLARADAAQPPHVPVHRSSTTKPAHANAQMLHVTQEVHHVIHQNLSTIKLVNVAAQTQLLTAKLQRPTMQLIVLANAQIHRLVRLLRPGTTTHVNWNARINNQLVAHLPASTGTKQLVLLSAITQCHQQFQKKNTGIQIPVQLSATMLNQPILMLNIDGTEIDVKLNANKPQEIHHHLTEDGIL